MKQINNSAIILAGGKGVRMQSDLPKVLHPLRDKPLISYVVESLHKADISAITVVVGYKGEMVMSALENDDITFVWQHEQLGTGHAVMQAEDIYKNYSGNIIIACGDVPLIMPNTFKKLQTSSLQENVKAVVLTMNVADPTGYGRVVKDENGAFLRIVEHKDANESEKQITEVNTGTYIFDNEFLFKGLSQINTNNAQGEYYLPDALHYVLENNFIVDTVLLEDPMEGTGINTKEELLKLEKRI